MIEMWANCTKILKKNINKIKPCKKCGYCPYGAMVEAFPLEEDRDNFSCSIFGHNCPMYYNAEDVNIKIKEKEE